MKQTIQRNIAEPLYLQLVRKIRNEVESGEYTPGQRLPSEQEMCALYGVSRITVRKALEKLNEEDVLERKQGKGTFVSVSGPRKVFRKIQSFHSACEGVGKKASTKVIYVKSCSAEEQDRLELQLPKNSRVVETCRIQMADSVPVMLEINRFSMAYSYLLDSDLNGSLYNLLSEYGVEPAHAQHDISLCRATDKQASLLSIDSGAPLIFLHEVIYDQKGRPLHTSRQYIRGDIFTLNL